MTVVLIQIEKNQELLLAGRFKLAVGDGDDAPSLFVVDCSELLL